MHFCPLRGLIKKPFYLFFCSSLIKKVYIKPPYRNTNLESDVRIQNLGINVSIIGDAHAENSVCCGVGCGYAVVV